MTVTYDASRVTLVDHPLVQHKLSILRDKNTGTNQFRQLVRELALFDGYEAMRDLPMEDVEVETPITTATFKQLAGKKLAIVPILRAGLGMVDGILDLVPSACVGHIGMVLCDEGDTVLLPTPCYPVFIAGSLLGGAKPWYYPLTKEHGFLPYVKDIPEDVARKAKYMIVSLPANPVGSVGSPELYAELVAFAKKYDILIIHDNAYSDIIFDGAVGNSFFNTPGAMDVGVEFFSLSKSFNVTGARISFLVGRRDVVAAFKKLRGQIDFGMFLPVQKAAIAALTGPLDMVKTQCGLYQQRRDALCGGLRSIGWNVPDSHGSMFVWAPIPAKYAKSMDFCLDLVEKSGVLCTPGSSFGPLGEGYVRFALTLPPERIAEAVQSIKASGILN